MKHFENVKMTLFDSTNASFKLAVEAQFTRRNPDGTYRDLVYTTDKYTAVLNPNIYLTFTYKDENSTAVYTSYPQIYQIRDALETVKNNITNPDAFMQDTNTGMLTLKQNYAEPVILANIGKNNNWIQFKLVVMQTDENGISKYEPGVSITLSTTQDYTSVLSREEFLTIYSIIKDLNLSTIQCMISLGFLNCDVRPMNYGYNPQYQNPAPAPQYGNNPNYQQTPRPQYQQNNYQNNYTRPTYGRNGYSSTPRQASYRTTQPNLATESNPQANAAYVAPKVEPINEPVREAAKPTLNLKDAIQETPVSQYDIDDTAALNSIFDSDN